MIPERLHWILDINPMTYFLDSYRQVLIYRQPPETGALFVIGVCSLLAAAVTIYYYSRYEHRMIKVL